MTDKLYRAFIINPEDEDHIRFYTDGALVVDSNGIILFCGNYHEAKLKFEDIETEDFRDYIISPGLIDLHTHLPQLSAMGCSSDELIPWLDNFIYSMEKKYEDEDFAFRASIDFFEQLKMNGTTTAVVYAPPQEKAAEISIDVADQSGMRIFIGNTIMDQNVPDELIHNHEDILRIMENLYNFTSNFNPRVQYIATPRFGITCSLELMKDISQFAKDKGIFIQTHLAENKNEIRKIKELFPSADNYTDLYDKAGLLSDKTILAHCIYLSDEELELLYNRKSAIAHCPTSNRFLQSGIMPLIKYLEKGHKIGLGTDIAGGYSLNLFHEAKEAIETSKTFNIINNISNHILTTQKAFYMATLGAAKILMIDEKTGNLSQGKEADFIVLNKDAFEDKFNHFNDESSLLSKILYTSSPFNVIKSFVKGESIFDLHRFDVSDMFEEEL